MARTQILTNNGETQYREARANGTNAVTVKAPAALAASIDFILPAALPATTDFLQISSTGVITTTAGTAGTLDDAYDSGGAGAGRVVTSDTGPLELAGVDGLRLNTTIPKIEFETDLAVFNWRIAANVGGNDFRIQRGDQDADISNDTFDDIFLIDGSNRRVGIHALPNVDLDVNASGLALGRPAAIRVGSQLGQDSLLQFYEDSTSRWEIGYDDSAGGLAIGRQTIDLDTVMFFEDVTGDIGIGELDPDAKLHVTDTVAGVGLMESSASSCRMSLKATGTANENQVFVGACFNELELGSGALVRAVLTAGGLFGINKPVPAARLDVAEPGDGKTAIRSVRSATGTGDANVFENGGTGSDLLLDQNGTGTALQIDSESTINPLILLEPLSANVRGDIAFGTARTADPASPQEGDLWYDGTAERMKIKTSLGGVFEGQTVASRYGANYGVRTVETISVGGVLAISSGYIQVAANSGTADDLDTITSASPVALPGDTIVLTADIGDTITVTEAGNIVLTGTTRVLGPTGNSDTMLLVKRSDGPEVWAELSYSNNS